MGEVRLAVDLAVPADLLWRAAGRLEGVNRELAPLLRMTTPPGLAGMTLADIEPGRTVGRCWLLLGGVIPIDYDDLCIVEVEPLRFLERSRMLTMDPWEHERTIEPAGKEACRLTDRLRFELRRPLRSVPGAGSLAVAIVSALFRHRHRRLAKLYGVPTERRGEESE